MRTLEAAAPIGVLLVDSSKDLIDARFRAFSRADGFEIVGMATSALQALSLVDRMKPRLVAVGAQLGAEDGIEVARRIMTRKPVPVVVWSEFEESDARHQGLVARAIRAGVVGVFPRLPPRTAPDYPWERQRLLRALSALAAVPMVTRHARAGTDARGEAALAFGAPRFPPRLVLIGASTGGPQVLQTILEGLPRPFPAAIVIVQHMRAGFSGTFTKWLSDAAGRPVRVCEGITLLDPDTFHLAPAGSHVRVTSASSLSVSDEPARHYQKPSVDVLFESAAPLGPSSIGVLLTGMGKDGATGLSKLKEAGAYTIVQSAASCVVDSMPRSAIELGAARAVLEPADIAKRLSELVSSRMPGFIAQPP